MHIRVMPLIWIAFGITNTKIIIIQFVFIGYIILTGYIITIRFVYEYIWINTFDNYIQIVSDCWGKRQMKQKQGNYHSSPFDCNNLGSQNITMTIKRDTHRRLNTHTQTDRHTVLLCSVGVLGMTLTNALVLTELCHSNIFSSGVITVQWKELFISWLASLSVAARLGNGTQ